MRKIISYLFILLAAPACAVVGAFKPLNAHYYIVSVVIAAIACLPLIIGFEKGSSPVAAVAVIAAMSAAAVASRAVFYAFPQIKPIAAVVIIAAAAFGPETGFLTGAVSMLISNVIFGQGTWTPFQMFALGLVGFVCGLIFKIERIKTNRFLIALIGGLSVLVFYGFIVDTSSVLFMTRSLTLESAIPVYAAGFPFNAIFAGTTAVVLLLISGQTIPRLERIKTKYNLFGGDDE